MNLPTLFVRSNRLLLGHEAHEELVDALQEEPPVSIRLNTAKQPVGTICASQAEVPWCSTGRYLDQRLTFTFDPLFHAGCYYVQEASSMFVEQAIKQHLPDTPTITLDLCAAPGGKSTHLRSLLPEGSLLVANELMGSRSQILAENLTKWGHPDVIVTNNKPADFTPLTSFFDLILCDAPCSGEGMFRKDPNAIDEWSSDNVTTCWQRQQRILSDIWPSLRPGGILIYSTCTYNTQENEENVQWMCNHFGAEVLPIDTPSEWGVTGNLLPDADFPVYRFFPHLTRGEGLFLAVVRKPMSSDSETHAPLETYLPVRDVSDKSSVKRKERRSVPTPPTLISKVDVDTAKSWLLAPETYHFSTHGTVISAINRMHQTQLAALTAAGLRMLQAGIEIAEAKGKGVVPRHALAVSNALRPDSFPTQEIGYEQAIAYLRKEAISLPETASRGFVLLTYQGVPLGFVKNIGNHANNLYPQEWRIRSGYLPQEVRILFTVSS